MTNPDIVGWFISSLRRLRLYQAIVNTLAMNKNMNGVLSRRYFN